MMKHLFSFPRQFGVLMIAVLLQWCVMPASAQGWVENKQGFPTDVAITKIKLKNNGGKSGIFNDITLVCSKKGDFAEGYFSINAKKLTAKTSADKWEFKDMEEAEDGWRILTLNKPAYFKFSGSSPCCYTNVQFYVDNTVEQSSSYNGSATGSDNTDSTNRESQRPTVSAGSPRRYLYEEKIKLTTPEKEGYTLLDTKNYGEYKCNYYLEGVRSFHFANGDFVTFIDNTSADTRDRVPKGGSVGDWRRTNEQGLVFKRENGVCKVELFDGSVLVDRYAGGLDWREDGLADVFIEYNAYGDQLYLPKQKEPLEFVSYGASSRIYDNGRRSLKDFEAGGYLLGDRLYAVVCRRSDENYGKVYAHQQIFEGIPYYALESDTIVKATYKDNCINLELKYANGDSLNLRLNHRSEYVIKSGIIHRNGGVLTIKEINGKQVQVLTWPNGDKFAGDFLYNSWTPAMGGSGLSDSLALKTLAEPELTLWNGTLIKADGTRLQYTKGKTPQQIAAERKREEAQLTAEYNAVCKMYGKQYVDAALVGKPIVGMPEELLLKVFRTELVESGYSKLYRIRGWGWKDFGRTYSDSALLYSVWVTNGRVSSVRYWGN